MRPSARRSVAIAAVALVVLGALRSLASGPLAGPPLTSATELQDWLDRVGAVGAAMAMVRAVAEVAAWYLLAVSLLQAVAVLTRSRILARVSAAVTAPLPRRVVNVMIGVAVTAAGSPTAWAGDRPLAPGVAVARPLNVGTAAAGPADTGGVAVGGPVTTSPPRPATLATAPPTTWTVERGESLWSIARDVLEGALGRPVADVETAPYWRQLIEVNRHRLVDPSDPDLILPGQVFELPRSPGLHLDGGGAAQADRHFVGQ